MMNKKLSLFLLLIHFLLPTIHAQDIAVIGLDGAGGDEFSFVLLRDFAANEVIYFTEDEYNDATGEFFITEGHVSYTIPTGGLLENEVITITETSANTFSVGCSVGGIATHIIGSWSVTNLDEMYAYSASNPATPYSSVTEVHCLLYTSNTGLVAGQDPSVDYPNAIVILNWAGLTGGNTQLLDGFRTNTTLAILQNVNNWSAATSSGITLSCTNFTNQMLPVELVAFKAEEKNENVYLNWSTASETNNQYFQIEHSIDGQHFEKIEQVDGVGNSVLINNYNFIHRDPASGLNYYRLKQVDFDGRFEYSDIVSVQLLAKHSEVSVYPNPFEKSVTVQFSSLENNFSDGNIEVYDIYGKLVHRVFLNESIVTLDLSKLVPGAYFLKAIESKRTIITQRIMKF